MFRIDKSFVENMNLNKEFVVITPKEIENTPPPLPATEVQRPAITEEDILRNATAKAGCIVADAKAAAEEMKKAAWQEGYREGIAQGQRETDALACAQAEDAKRVFEKIEVYKRDLHDDLQNNVLSLAFDIAEKIINLHLKKDDTLYVGIAREAIQALNSSSKFALRVSRSEYDRFFGKGGQWMRDEIGCAPFEVICDPTMAENGCIVESDEGVVNAGVSEQLGKLRRIIDGRTESDEVL